MTHLLNKYEFGRHGGRYGSKATSMSGHNCDLWWINQKIDWDWMRCAKQRWKPERSNCSIGTSVAPTSELTPMTPPSSTEFRLRLFSGKSLARASIFCMLWMFFFIYSSFLPLSYLLILQSSIEFSPPQFTHRPRRNGFHCNSNWFFFHLLHLWFFTLWWWSWWWSWWWFFSLCFHKDVNVQWQLIKKKRPSALTIIQYRFGAAPTSSSTQFNQISIMNPTIKLASIILSWKLSHVAFCNVH